ncbi:MAG: 4Fe-4S binding protein [Candidatus Zophobacter franzmannii]|nr:4Fe-4S binding protein [Candidatus Zophobacter franzmannii]
MAKMTVNPEYCKGCGLCINACPKKIIAFSENITTKVITTLNASIRRNV